MLCCVFVQYSTAYVDWNFSSLPHYTSLVLVSSFLLVHLSSIPLFLSGPILSSVEVVVVFGLFIFSFETCVIVMDYYVCLAHWHAGFALA